MAKNKLKKFKQINDFYNVLEPSIDGKELHFDMSGRWHEIFNNNNPIILELGCGKGEYSVALAERYPESNFIGVDIKGNRLWAGANLSISKGLKNIRFLRIRIEYIEQCFHENEVSKIWITFPDPQIKRRRSKRRLTHPNFLRKYKTFLKKEGTISLKTDSEFLYGYTLGIIENENHDLLDCTHDVYNGSQIRSDIDIETYYERKFLDKNKLITFLNFRLNH